MRLAEADVNDRGIAAITGHEPKSVTAILKHYWFPTHKIARAAFAKRLEGEKGG
ncbi:MAG: hypothetical protein V3R74_10680 [Alphaproteobacteria bacterium]